MYSPGFTDIRFVSKGDIRFPSPPARARPRGLSTDWISISLPPNSIRRRKVVAVVTAGQNNFTAAQSNQPPTLTIGRSTDTIPGRTAVGVQQPRAFAAPDRGAGRYRPRAVRQGGARQQQSVRQPHSDATRSTCCRACLTSSRWQARPSPMAAPSTCVTELQRVERPAGWTDQPDPGWLALVRASCWMGNPSTFRAAPRSICQVGKSRRRGLRLGPWRLGQRAQHAARQCQPCDARQQGGRQGLRHPARLRVGLCAHRTGKWRRRSGDRPADHDSCRRAGPARPAPTRCRCRQTTRCCAGAYRVELGAAARTPIGGSVCDR